MFGICCNVAEEQTDAAPVRVMQLSLPFSQQQDPFVLAEDHSPEADLQSRPKSTFEVVLQRTRRGTKIGLNLKKKRTKQVLIMGFKPEGLAVEYNKLAAIDGRASFRPGQLILSVNGYHAEDDPDAMLEELAEASEMVVRIQAAV
eukprot:TRINITY_DN59350_c0_g1_i1.p1 TRINITY_DN59350_c0_g1~~TRINITY_DN59350_c0_g1_i1.p1  ORF type:complete len:145 (+),score=28.09 TRINITY_DN59350_c0_g1_i1:92-526(+)